MKDFENHDQPSCIKTYSNKKEPALAIYELLYNKENCVRSLRGFLFLERRGETERKLRRAWGIAWSLIDGRFCVVPNY